MKTCPRCGKIYTDENLNFCLDDGEFLQRQKRDDAPPTVIIDAPRVTDQTNWQPPPAAYNAPMSAWQNQPPDASNQPFADPTFNNRTFNQSRDQTLPTVSLVLGILSFLLICCYGGFPLGLAAIITGFLGMKNADASPMQYGGRGLAIGGIVLGAVSLLSSIVFLIFAVLAN